MISVVVPVYNVEMCIRRALDSILQQSYTDWEALLVDDGSTDNSGKICDEYSKHDNRFRVYHTENNGLSCARNLGIENSIGEYVAFMDSDDFYHPEFLNLLLNCLLKTGADIVTAEYIRILEGREPIWDMPEDTSSYEMFSKEEMLMKLCYGESKYEMFNAVIVMNKLYRRAAIGNCRFVERQIHEDEMFSFDIIFSNSRFARVPYKMYAYVIRTSSESISSVRMGKHTRQKLCFIWKRTLTLKEGHSRAFLASLCHYIRLMQNYYVFEKYEQKKAKEELDELLKSYQDSVAMYRENGRPSLKLIIRHEIFIKMPWIYNLICLEKQKRNMKKTIRSY